MIGRVQRPGDLCNENIVFGWMLGSFISRQFLLYEVCNKSCNLRRQYVEIVGKENKYDTNAQADTVFPEILVEGFKMFQTKGLL